jgi:hypothetical protein
MNHNATQTAIASIKLNRKQDADNTPQRGD